MTNHNQHMVCDTRGVVSVSDDSGRMVTRQMIEAGITELMDSGATPHLSSADELLVAQIYLAMEAARLKQDKGNLSRLISS